MTTAREIFREFLAKGAGPGSRGGHVIGHTSSGRPIYAKSGSGHVGYAGFTAKDHFEAARQHLGRVGILNHRARGNPSKAPQTPKELALAARAGRHMAHYLGHIRRAKRMNEALPPAWRLEALA